MSDKCKKCSDKGTYTWIMECGCDTTEICDCPAGDVIREENRLKRAAQAQTELEILRSRIETLEAENFTLAAGHCIYDLIGDEGGHFECTKVLELRSALQGMLDRFTDLVNCGDCGKWDPETEEPVIVARKALR